MHSQSHVPRPLHPSELQALQQLFQQGNYAQAEAKALALLQVYRNAVPLYNLLGMCQQAQGKNQAALASFEQLLQRDPTIAEIHFNLGVIYTQLDNTDAAIACYRKALQLKPQFTPAHFNLGTLLQAQGFLKDAARHYQTALSLEPSFVEALGNLGTVLQLQGQLAAAEQCYRRALALRPDARGHFNLGTLLHDQGEHQAAIAEFRLAVALAPDFTDAWNDLGETLRDRGAMDEAVRCYEQALAVDPHHPRARYNLGEYCCLDGRWADAIPYFAASTFADAQDRVLQCLYKTRQFTAFQQGLAERLDQLPHASILLGTLATHYATNFQLPNHYNFCPDPMNYVLHTRIERLAEPDSPLLRELLHDIQHLAIAERKQGRLYYGMQSAGNLFMRSEASIQELAQLIRAKIREYQQHFAHSSADLIQQFPQDIEFSSSWYLRMKQGGYLTSHIHEEGWISGCVYLQLPDKQNAHAGSFEYSTDGDDYPRLHENFPRQIVDQQVGDLVLFPSSLFHRTLPFHSAQERVCVAFDLQPALS